MSGSLAFWIPVTRVIPKIGFVLTVTFGSILLLLNFFGAQKHFGSYKNLLSSITVLGIVFAFIETFVYPNVHNYKASSFLFSFDDSLELNDSWAKNVPLAGYTFLHAAIMSLLSVQFVYRYWAIFDNRKLYLFKGPYNLIWILYCSFFGLQYSLGNFFFLAKDKMANDYLRNVIQISYNVNIENLPGMCVLPYDPVDGSIRWWNLMGVFNIMAIVNLQYSIMTFCGYSMHLKMEDKIKNFSEALRKHHKQFFKTLVLQVTMPTIILFIPITIIICLPLFNLDVNIPFGVVQCSFTLYPAADSLIVMYVVSEYRVTAKKFRKSFTRSFGKSETIRVGVVSSTSVTNQT